MMDKTQLLISVILPVCNAEKFLSASLDSLLAQTHKRFEIIAIDDNSKDNSFTILKKYQRSDKRIRVFKNIKRYGKAVTLNRAIKRAKGKILAFMKATDINHPDRLRQQLAYLHDNQKTVAVGVQCTLVNDDDSIGEKSNFPSDHVSIYKKPLNGISFLFENLMINTYRLPKDALHFGTNKQPFLYSDMIFKLLSYGEITNLSQFLYLHRKEATPHSSFVTHYPLSLVKVWFRAITLHDHYPSLSSLFIRPLLANLK